MAEQTVAPVHGVKSGLGRDDPFVQSWVHFFSRYYRGAINEAALAAGGSRAKKDKDPAGRPLPDDGRAQRSLYVSFHDIERAPTLADHLVTAPMQSLAHAEEALKAIDVPVDPRPFLHVRISMRKSSLVDEHGEPAALGRDRALPDGVRFARLDGRVVPSSLTYVSVPPAVERLGQLVTVRARVKRVSAPRPDLRDAVYQCERCGCFIRAAQTEFRVLKEPMECYEDQGGCGRDSAFQLIVSEIRGQVSKWVMVQRVTLEQVLDDVEPGIQPDSIDAWLEDDLCGVEAAKPGHIVLVTGVLRCRPQSRGNAKSTTADIFLDASSIELEDTQASSLAWTPEDDETLRQLMALPPAARKAAFVNAFEPDVAGYDFAKYVLLLALIGGNASPKARGQIHTALIGDPATAKTLLARRAAQLAARYVHINGKGVSVASLTLAAKKPDENDKHWSLEAGAWLMASGGVLWWDEAQESPEDTKAAANEPMESQVVTKSAPGISATVTSDTTLILVANPSHGYFDEFEPLPDQFEIPGPTQSRFDAIFVFRDKAEPNADRQIVEAILRRRTSDGAPPPPQPDGLVLSHDFLRRFIAKARLLRPVHTPESRSRIIEAALQLRARRRGDGSSLAFTHRQSESLPRLAEAIARFHLRETVLAEDVAEAAEIVARWIKDAYGEEADRGTLTTGISIADAATIKTLKAEIRKYTSDRRGAELDIVLHGFPTDDHPKLLKTIDFLASKGELELPEPGRVRMV